MHCSPSNLAGRWEFGSPERQKKLSFPVGSAHTAPGNSAVRASRGAGRARAVTAAPGKGGREPGPGLAGLRGGTGQRDGPSAARASARSPVIQHPDFQTGGRGRSSSLAVPRPRVARERATYAPRGPRGRAGPSPGPSPRRREPAPPDARGGQADGATRRETPGKWRGSAVNDHGASRAARREPVREARQAPGRGATAPATSGRHLSASAAPGAWDGEQRSPRAGLTPKMSGSFPARRRLAEARLGGGVVAGGERAESRRCEPWAA